MADPESLLSEHGVSDDWLVSNLRQAGVVGEAELVSREAAVIGTGQVGENMRLSLHWSGPGANAAPSSLVVKVPSTSEVSRATSAATRTYVREVGFYRDLQAHVDITTPTPYAVTEDREANRFVLVMEDIAPAVQGDQLTGCSPAEAELAIVECAKLHGSTWGQDELLAFDWLDEATPASATDRVQLYADLFPGFADRYDGFLTRDEIEIGRRLGGQLERLALTKRGARCVAHGDFRLDNLLFGTGPQAPPITTVDWQTLTYSYGLNDMAYFISTGLAPEVRRRHESRLLDLYQSVLTGYGVDLDRDGVVAGYRLGSITGYVMGVIASQIVEQTARGDEMFVAIIRGSASLMVDLDLEL
ncbi:MAG: phosphotransferase [Actinomycetia bacterium]|nr:phosphotransferase [Actinomycetes bacterium]